MSVEGAAAVLRAAVAAAIAATRGAFLRARSALVPRIRSGASTVHATVRRRPDAVLAALLLAGVLLMVAHWRGSASGPAEREPPQQHAIAGP